MTRVTGRDPARDAVRAGCAPVFLSATSDSEGIRLYATAAASRTSCFLSNIDARSSATPARLSPISANPHAAAIRTSFE